MTDAYVRAVEADRALGGLDAIDPTRRPAFTLLGGGYAHCYRCGSMVDDGCRARRDDCPVPSDGEAALYCAHCGGWFSEIDGAAWDAADGCERHSGCPQVAAETSPAGE